MRYGLVMAARQEQALIRKPPGADDYGVTRGQVLRVLIDLFFGRNLAVIWP